MRTIIVLLSALLSAMGMTGWGQASGDRWGIVNHSVANMRISPSHASELISQATMGTPVKVLGEDDYWRKVETPEGYTGWMHMMAVSNKTSDEMQAWRQAPRLIMTDYYQIPVYATQGNQSPRNVVTDLVANSIVEGNLNEACGGQVLIILPDRRQGWAAADKFMPLEKWAAQDFNADKILNQAYALEGTPYLWGGTSSKSTDCSGLVKVSYLANGYILKRDASQQVHTGTPLPVGSWASYEPADLVFFGNKATGKVTHVGLYDRDGMIIHSSALIRRNSIDPSSSQYLGREVIKAVRIHGNEGTEGIVQARNHPWYFNQK